MIVWHTHTHPPTHTAKQVSWNEIQCHHLGQALCPDLLILLNNTFWLSLPRLIALPTPRVLACRMKSKRKSPVLRPLCMGAVYLCPVACSEPQEPVSTGSEILAAHPSPSTALGAQCTATH